MVGTTLLVSDRTELDNATSFPVSIMNYLAVSLHEF